MDPIKHPPTDPAAEANHRFANALSLLSGLVRMQAKAAARASQPLANAEVRLMLDGIAARISTLGQLHRLLSQVPADGALAFKSHLRDIGGNLVATFSSEQRPVSIDYAGGDYLVAAKYVQPVTLILCEILTNAMKYSHPAGVAVRIALLCEAARDGTLQVTVSDDGVGLPEGFDTEKDGGLGFRIIRTLTSELNARLDVFSDNLGTTFRLSVPQALVASVQTA
jgi:two-component sensor histidine kinase